MSLIENFNKFLNKLSENKKYKILPGDTYYKISQGIPGMTIDDLIEANPGVDPKKLQIGQEINLPQLETLEKETEKYKAVVTADDMKDLVEQVAVDVGVPLKILKGLIAKESSGDPSSISHSGAKGLTQLMPETLKKLRITDPFDVKQNVLGGAKWLKVCYNEAKELRGLPNLSDEELWEYALMIYHAGSPAVQKWVDAGQPAEGFSNVGRLTLSYPKEVLRLGQESDIFKMWPV